jgi:hypothetical protein
MPKSSRALLLLIGSIALAGCGAKTHAAVKLESAQLVVTPAPRESSAPSLPASFPGRRPQTLQARSSELVQSSARVLLRSEDGSVELLAGRSRSGRLCAGAISPLSGESAIRCLAASERPPVLGFMSMTGRRGFEVVSASVVGLADPAVARVAVELQDLSRKPVRLRRLPGLPWRVFSAGPYKNTAANSSDFAGLPSTLIAFDGAGRELGAVDLSFGYPHCRADLCHYKQTEAGTWVIVRDAIASQQYAKISAALERLAKQLVLSDARVRQIVSGRQFSLGPLAYWQKCDGEMIGVSADLLLAYPVSIKGTLPYTTYEKGLKHAYLEGLVSYDSANVREIAIEVDLNRKRVVSIDPSIGDDVTVTNVRQVGKPHPAGGPDTAGCYDEGD